MSLNLQLIKEKTAEFANVLNLRQEEKGGRQLTQEEKADNRDRSERIAKVFAESIDENGFLKCEELTNPETGNSGIEIKKLLDLGGQSYIFSAEIPNLDALNPVPFYQRILQHKLREAEGENLDNVREKYAAMASDIIKYELKRSSGRAFIRSELRPILDYKLRGGTIVRVSRGDSIYSDDKAGRVKALDGLVHDNLVFSAVSGEIPHKRNFSVMEYVGNIVNSKKICEALTQEEHILIIMQSALGLKVLYELGTAHRDVKPDNIFIVKGNSGKPKAKVADFGLIRITERENPESATVTKDAMFLGTVAYSSPEHTTDPKSVDIRSDICCLGLTAYYWITGVDPLAGEGSAEKMENAVNRTVKPKRIIDVSNKVRYRGILFYSNFGLDRYRLAARYSELERVIAKMIHLDRGKRYKEPHEVVDDLEKVLKYKKVDIGDIDIYDVFR